MFIRVSRSRKSLQYKRNIAGPAARDNNDGNNSLDLVELFLDGIAGQAAPIFSCRAQTVPNLEGLDAGVAFADIILPGPFQLHAFVDPRSYWCQPHGICNTRTLYGDLIRADSTTPLNPNRWLMHDWQLPKPSPSGQDTRVAWSAACIVVQDADLVAFSGQLTAHGVKPGDLVDGELIMMA